MKAPFVLTATALSMTVATARAQPVAIETRPNRSMLTIGLFAFGQPYVASMGIAATSSTTADANLWIPVLGPWLDLGARPACSGSPACGTQNGYKVLLAADGILQSFGAFEIVSAFIWPEVVPVTKVVALRPERFGSDGYGVAAVGHF